MYYITNYVTKIVGQSFARRLNIYSLKTTARNNKAHSLSAKTQFIGIFCEGIQPVSILFGIIFVQVEEVSPETFPRNHHIECQVKIEVMLYGRWRDY